MVINCKKPCKKKRSTMLTVEQMVDIALGTPEIGAVNFNVLHALIHVIIQQLNIQKCLVEFKGYDSDRMEGIILSAKPGPILKLSEYMIDVNDGKPCPGKDKPAKQGKEEDECKEEAKESSGKKAPCECSGKKKKSTDDEKEKSDKGKEESDAEDKKKVIKKELTPEECQEEEEPERKKIKEVKKPCPCKTKEQDICADESLKAVPSSYYGSDSEGTCQTIVRVEPVGERCDSWRSRPALAHESMVKLEEKVAMLQDAFEALEQMPTNEELKKRTQGTGCVSTPVKDLWQLYNLNKRVESCEGTIEKLASMIEDLVKETCNFREAMMVIAGAVDDIECADQTGRSCCAALQGRSGSITGVPAAAPARRTPSKSGETQTVTFNENERKPCEEKKDPQDQQSKAVKPPLPAAPPPKQTPPPPIPPAPEPEKAAPAEASPPPVAPAAPAAPPAPTAPPTPAAPPAAVAAAPVSAPPPPPATTVDCSGYTKTKTEATAAIPAAAEESALPPPERAPYDPNERSITPSELVGIGPEFYKMSAGEKFCVLKEYVDCLVCQIKTMAQNTQGPASQLAAKLCALVSMQKQLDALEKELREFLSPFGAEGFKGLSRFLSDLRKDIDRMDSLISKLIIDQKQSGNNIKMISDEAENLKRVKADLEVVEDLLAGKADASLVNRKVSHDQFDAACDDLTRGLDEALEKLMQQEALWNEAMEEIQRDLENKLDKIEIMPLKEFITKKLRCLQEKLKQLAQLRKDAEAAGAKSRILRNLNCIACDADVVMKMDNKSSFQHGSVQPSKNLKPMLTYELDQVRKAMKKGPPCRGGPQTDDAYTDAQRKAIGIPLTHREAIDNKVSKLAHFCNRYCGGSHTITTPQQRVTRIGHFLTEFGPQAMAMFNQDFEESKTSGIGLPVQGNLNADYKPC